MRPISGLGPQASERHAWWSSRLLGRKRDFPFRVTRENGALRHHQALSALGEIGLIDSRRSPGSGAARGERVIRKDKTKMLFQQRFVVGD